MSIILAKNISIEVDILFIFIDYGYFVAFMVCPKYIHSNTYGNGGSIQKKVEITYDMAFALEQLKVGYNRLPIHMMNANTFYLKRLHH